MSRDNTFLLGPPRSSIITTREKLEMGGQRRIFLLHGCGPITIFRENSRSNFPWKYDRDRIFVIYICILKIAPLSL